MSKVDIIILTNTENIKFFEMTSACINSYIQHGDDYINQIILMETNAEWNPKSWEPISPKIQVVCPKIPFNYNQYLNIAFKLVSSSLVCISNNDVVIQQNCIQKIVEAFENDPLLMSASPIDRTWHRNSYNDFPEDNAIYVGYETTKYLLGFNIYLRKATFDILGPYDERFDFYFQDNDYEMGLRQNKLKHALISSAHIVHGQNKPTSENLSIDLNKKMNQDCYKFVQKWRSLLNV